MSLYNRYLDSQPAAARARGGSSDASDAGIRLTENLLSGCAFKPTPGEHFKAAQAFQEALTGKSSASLAAELPPLEVNAEVPTVGDTAALDTSSLDGVDLAGQMKGLMQSVMDVAMKLADPLAFIGAICEFLFSLFANAGSDFTQALQQIDAYNQAAQAALDTEKLTSQVAPD